VDRTPQRAIQAGWCRGTRPRRCSGGPFRTAADSGDRRQGRSGRQRRRACREDSSSGRIRASPSRGAPDPRVIWPVRVTVDSGGPGRSGLRIGRREPDQDVCAPRQPVSGERTRLAVPSPPPSPPPASWPRSPSGSHGPAVRALPAQVRRQRARPSGIGPGQRSRRRKAVHPTH
jgi:hypothetical protein